MKFSLGKPELLNIADDFYDYLKWQNEYTFCHIVAESISFFASIEKFCFAKQGGFMLASLSLIFIVGLALGAICQKLKLPRIIGILVTGIVLGPYVLDLLDPSILSISAELRKLALIIILLKAGLSLDLKDLKKPDTPLCYCRSFRHRLKSQVMYSVPRQS